MSLFTGNHFYWQQTKTFITAFGSVFQDITIEKENIDGVTVQQYEVPIDYSPKNKWTTLVAERPDYTTNQVQITLPRLTFEITSMKLNMSRKIGFNGTYSVVSLNTGKRTKIYNPTPIDLTVNLYALTRDNEDMYQIIEQILPYFQSTLIMNLELLPEFNLYKDIPISLIDVSTVDNYTGAVDEQRLVETTFTFHAQMFYFGPVDVNGGKIIKDVRVALNSQYGNMTNYKAVVDPFTVEVETTPHEVIESWNP